MRSQVSFFLKRLSQIFHEMYATPAMTTVPTTMAPTGTSAGNSASPTMQGECNVVSVNSVGDPMLRLLRAALLLLMPRSGALERAARWAERSGISRVAEKLEVAGRI